MKLSSKKQGFFLGHIPRPEYASGGFHHKKRFEAKYRLPQTHEITRLTPKNKLYRKKPGLFLGHIPRPEYASGEFHHMKRFEAKNRLPPNEYSGLETRPKKSPFPVQFHFGR